MPKRILKGGAMLAPVPAVMVSVGDGEEKNVLTVAWCGTLCTTPPKTYISVRPERFSYQMIKESGEFVINLPSADLVRAVDFCGMYTGAKVNKIEKCKFTLEEPSKVSVPIIGECPIALECRVEKIVPLGSHDMFVADIVSVSVDERLLNRDGKMEIERANLLAYAHGDYFALGKRLGCFGFSSMKKNSQKKKNAAVQRNRKRRGG